MQTNDLVHLFQVSIPYFTNIPEDVIVNTWHFVFDDGVGGSPSVTDYGVALDKLKAFYDAFYAAAARPEWVQPVLNVKAYELWQPEPRLPVFAGSRAIAGTALASSTVPPETAICMSYRANYIGGVPQARQRGRIYLGGIGGATVPGSASTFPVVGTSVRTAISTAAQALNTAMAAANWDWYVLSPTQVAASGQETFRVAHGWVDNALDTQRRRGVPATARTVW